MAVTRVMDSGLEEEEAFVEYKLWRVCLSLTTLLFLLAVSLTERNQVSKGHCEVIRALQQKVGTAVQEGRELVVVQLEES